MTTRVGTLESRFHDCVTANSHLIISSRSAQWTSIGTCHDGDGFQWCFHAESQCDHRRTLWQTVLEINGIWSLKRTGSYCKWIPESKLTSKYPVVIVDALHTKVRENSCVCSKRLLAASVSEKTGSAKYSVSTLLILNLKPARSSSLHSWKVVDLQVSIKSF